MESLNPRGQERTACSVKAVSGKKSHNTGFHMHETSRIRQSGDKSRTKGRGSRGRTLQWVCSLLVTGKRFRTRQRLVATWPVLCKCFRTAHAKMLNCILCQLYPHKKKKNTLTRFCILNSKVLKTRKENHPYFLEATLVTEKSGFASLRNGSSASGAQSMPCLF